MLFGIVGGTAVDPQSLSYLRLLRFARSDSQRLCAWKQEGDLCEGMRIGKEERMVQRRPFHATQLPGSQSSEMPKESCISFIAGQTEQPGVEGPLEDNIPKLMPSGITFLVPVLKLLTPKPFISTFISKIHWHLVIQLFVMF